MPSVSSRPGLNRELTTAAALPVEHATLGQFAHDLLGEKRVTGGPLGDLLAQLANRGVVAEQLGDQCCGLRIAQRPKGDALSTGHPAQRVPIFGAVADQHQRARLRDHRQKVRKHGFADLVDPVHVLNDINCRGLAGQ
jgi:hypothetical protein